MMKITYVTFGLGFLAIIGVPPFAGFWSKDEIIYVAFSQSFIIGMATLLGAGVTAFYMTRMMAMTFFGEARWQDDVHPHESPAVMTIPMIVLAFGSVFGGMAMLFVGDIEHWLEPVVHHSERNISGTWAYENKWLLLALAIAIAVSGIAASIAVYAKGKFKVIEPAILADAWRYDSTISSLIGGPGYKSFDGVASFDAVVVDGVVNGAGIEVRRISGVLSNLQTGLIRSYAAIVAFGAVAVLAWFLVRGVL
jgi:NADH-quinone oxidoreductase subunit L